MVIRNIDDVDLKPVQMDGVQGASMAIMVGREHGAPNFALRQFKVAPGGHTPRHSHDYEHEVFIVEGGGTIFLQGQERPIRAGDVILVPANEEHQFRAATTPAPGSDAALRFLCLVPVTRNCGDPTPGS
jgi:quercetin dioxygenase-like cupin family protein